MSSVSRAKLPAARRDGRSADLKGTARERLLDAALAEFRERGYEGASLQSIARRAGLTKGAVYWNFQNKQDLFAVLIEERLDAPARKLMKTTETAAGDEETAPLVSEGIARLIREQPELLLALHEQWALCVRNPGLRPPYLRRQAMLREGLARVLETRHATTGVPLTYPAERLATAIIALANGLAMEAMVDPDRTPDELLGEILQLLYDGLARRAGSQGAS